MRNKLSSYSGSIIDPLCHQSKHFLVCLWFLFPSTGNTKEDLGRPNKQLLVSTQLMLKSRRSEFSRFAARYQGARRRPNANANANASEDVPALVFLYVRIMSTGLWAPRQNK